MEQKTCAKPTTISRTIIRPKIGTDHEKRTAGSRKKAETKKTEKKSKHAEQNVKKKAKMEMRTGMRLRLATEAERRRGVRQFLHVDCTHKK